MLDALQTAAAFACLRAEPGTVAAMVMRSWAALGVREDGGKNRGRWVDAIVELGGGDDEDAPAWCALACCAAWIAGCHALGLHPLLVTSGGVARLWQRQTRDSAILIPIAAVREGAQLLPGDILIRGRDEAGARRIAAGQSAYGHAELVVRHVVGAEWLHTAGGNTTSADSAEGDGVYDKPRGHRVDDARIVGFVRPLVRTLVSA
jgi:hypothetical protein